jgi:magnesium transporter
MCTLIGFMLYVLTVLIFSLVMIYGVAPKHGRDNPLVYVSICSLVGSVSVMAIKG